MKFVFPVLLLGLAPVSCSKPQEIGSIDFAEARDSAIEIWMGKPEDSNPNYVILADAYAPIVDRVLSFDESMTDLECLRAVLPKVPPQLLQLMTDTKIPSSQFQALSNNPRVRKLPPNGWASINDKNGGSFWENMEKILPNCLGIVTTSPVVFSAELSQAVIYITFSCGELCGEGAFLWLQYEQGQWRLLEEISLWVS
jgi:hypothetical protein